MMHETEENTMIEKQMIEGMTRRTKLIAAAAVLAGVFLLGFVPQYGKARTLRTEAGAGQAQIVSLQWKLKLAELRDLMGLVYLETNQKNYGVARQHSTKFFTKARQLAAETSDPSLTAMLQEILQHRDHVTAGLTEGQPAIRTNLEEVLRKLYESTRQY
jgi:hypothetical protein